MRRRFQLWVLAAILLTVLVELLHWFYIPSDGVKFDQWSIYGYGTLIDGDLVTYVLLLASRVLILFGLYTFHPSARRLFLFYVSLIVVLTLLPGWRVIPTIIIAPVSNFLWLIDGAILALAFYSPASAEFKERAT